MNSRIPKRIIQTGKNIDLPLRSKASTVNLKLLNPDYDYLFFDNNQVEDFVDKQFPEYRNVFNSFRVPIQRYDFFRYLAIFHFGGFYFDLDVFLVSSLSDLLQYGCVFTFEKIAIGNYLIDKYNMDWEIGNYAFGASPGHPFIGAIIDNCVKAQTRPEWAEVMLKSIPWLFRKDSYVLCTTGPGLVSRTYAENPELVTDVKVLFPENIYDRKNWYHFGRYGTHLMESSWRKRRNKLHNYIWHYWYSRTENKNIRLGKMKK